jgi:hypothetical protein
MKVKELIKLLESVNPETDLFCTSEDPEVLDSNSAHKFKIFEVSAVEEVNGTKSRGDDGIATFKIGKDNNSEPHTIMEITCDI